MLSPLSHLVLHPLTSFHRQGSNSAPASSYALEASSCDFSCNDDSSESCGGNNALDVYAFTKYTSVEWSCASFPPSLSVFFLADCSRFLDTDTGCFADGVDGKRTFPNRVARQTAWTQEAVSLSLSASLTATSCLSPSLFIVPFRCFRRWLQVGRYRVRYVVVLHSHSVLHFLTFSSHLAGGECALSLSPLFLSTANIASCSSSSPFTFRLGSSPLLVLLLRSPANFFSPVPPRRTGF
jgi:hypothetical protein